MDTLQTESKAISDEKFLQIVMSGDIKACQAAIDAGANVNAKNKNGTTVLHHAVFHSMLEVMELLLLHGADANAQDTGAGIVAPLFYAHDEARLRLLAIYGADINARDSIGYSALHHTAQKDPADEILLLLKYGADINAQSSSQDTPLHLAAYGGRENAAKVLVECGASKTAKNNVGRTPAEYAGDAKRENIAVLIDSIQAESKGVKREDLSALQKLRRLVLKNQILPSGLSPVTVKEQHEGAVVCVAIFTDGRVASGDSKGIIKIWDSNSKDCVDTFTAHSGNVIAITELRNGNLASGGSDHKIKCWDVSKKGEKKPIRELQGYGQVNVRALISLPNGDIAAGFDGPEADSGTIRIWDAKESEPKRLLTGHTSYVLALEVFQEKYLISGSWDHTIRIWDIKNDYQCLENNKSEDDNRALVLLPNGWIAAGGADGIIKIWAEVFGKWLRQKEHDLVIPGHVIEALAVLENGRLLVSSSYLKNQASVRPINAVIKIWDLRNGQCLNTFSYHQVARVIKTSRNGNLICGFEDGTLQIWAPHKKVGMEFKQIPTLKSSINDVQVLALSPDKRFLACSGPSTNSKEAKHTPIEIWDIEKQQCVKTLESLSPELEIEGLTFLSPNQLVSTSGPWGRPTGAIQIWNLETGSAAKNDLYIGAFAFIPHRRQIAYTVPYTKPGMIRFWNIDKKEDAEEKLQEHKEVVQTVLLLQNGWLASGAHDNTIKLWDLNSNQCFRTLEGHTGAVLALAQQRNGCLVSGSGDKTIKVWNIATGQVQTLQGHSNSIFSLAIFQDKWLLSSSADKTIKVWDLEDGRCVHTEKVEQNIHSLTILPHDRIAYGSADGIKIFKLEICNPALAEEQTRRRSAERREQEQRVAKEAAERIALQQQKEAEEKAKLTGKTAQTPPPPISPTMVIINIQQQPAMPGGMPVHSSPIHAGTALMPPPAFLPSESTSQHMKTGDLKGEGGQLGVAAAANVTAAVKILSNDEKAGRDNIGGDKNKAGGNIIKTSNTNCCSHIKCTIL